MSKNGTLTVICAPSGTGKSTLIERLKKDFPELKWSVSCTTRPMRAGEKEGVDYYFLSVDQFEKKLKLNEFIEWAKVHSNYYGTSKTFVDLGVNKGEHLLFDLDVQGADAMKKIYGSEAKVIFIAPPSVEELERRLKGRATDSQSVIEERITNAKNELKRKDDYDELLINDDLERAYNELKTIFTKILGRNRA